MLVVPVVCAGRHTVVLLVSAATEAPTAEATAAALGSVAELLLVSAAVVASSEIK